MSDATGDQAEARQRQRHAVAQHAAGPEHRQAGEQCHQPHRPTGEKQRNGSDEHAQQNRADSGDERDQKDQIEGRQA
jgi:hypothetical protein